MGGALLACLPKKGPPSWPRGTFRVKGGLLVTYGEDTFLIYVLSECAPAQIKLLLLHSTHASGQYIWIRTK